MTRRQQTDERSPDRPLARYASAEMPDTPEPSGGMMPPVLPTATPSAQRRRAAREGRAGARGRFLITMDDEMYAAVRSKAAVEGRPMTVICREAIRLHVLGR